MSNAGFVEPPGQFFCAAGVIALIAFKKTPKRRGLTLLERAGPGFQSNSLPIWLV
jgi:hypothetical protein